MQSPSNQLRTNGSHQRSKGNKILPTWFAVRQYNHFTMAISIASSQL